MVTVAHLVENIISKKPYLQQAVIRGIVNYAALAELLKEEIEHEMKKEVKLSAIMMALRRLHDSLSERSDTMFDFEVSSEISLKSNLFSMTIAKTPTVFEKIDKIYSLIDFRKGDALSITQGNFEVTLISNMKYLNDVRKIMQNEDVVEEMFDLSALSIGIPKEANKVPGVIYTFLKELAWENINVIEVVSTYSELMIIILDKDAADAYKSIKKLMTN